MVKHHPRTPNLLAGLVLASTLAGCAGAPAKQEEPKAQNSPVKWTQEFNMPGLLDQPVAVNSQKDLRKLRESPWYASVAVEAPDLNEPQAIDSCNDYFAVNAENLRAHKAQEHNALLELMVMCEATRLLSEASPAKQSNIPEQPLDAQLPDRLPKSVALVTSQSEWNRIENDQNVSSWGEVNTINEVKKTSAHQAEYHLDTGLQTVSILGRGDFNEDGREDLLVSVKDTVEGGSYFNLRLFVLTVTDQGEWRVEAEY